MEQTRRVKLQPLSGFPEYLPSGQLAFERVRSLIEGAYRRYGFVPVETPAVERWQVLTTKGGIQKQIYSVGRPRPRTQADAAQLDMFDLLNPEMGLRFDLTVPLARYVVQHANDLTFPFRRYQIQPVWRGERSQKGRFREFYQADVDIVGRSKLDPLYDAEMLAVMTAALDALECLPGFRIHISNRRILSGLMADFGIAETADEAIREIDKAARDGMDKALNQVDELVSGGPTGFMQTLHQLMHSKGSNIDALKEALNGRAQALAGLNELETVYSTALRLGVPEDRLLLDPTIARGLDYYTGTVFETFVSEREEWGSIASGGRYDDLASVFGAQRFPGVGGSIGLSRLAGLLMADGLLAEETATTADVLVTILDRDEHMDDYLALASEVRAEGIACEIFLQKARLGEQLGYADRMGFRLAVIAGGDEFERNVVKIKNVAEREEKEIKRSELLSYLRAKLQRS